MRALHYQYWPKNIPHVITIPQIPVYYNLEVAANRYPSKTAIRYYGAQYSYGKIKKEVDSLAGYLQMECGVQKGDRVILYMQNSPQFVIAYYAILRADAVVVPSNPMNLTEEMRHYLDDSGASIAICGSELSQRLEALMGADGLRRVIVASYEDYAAESGEISFPDYLKTPSLQTTGDGFLNWNEALNTANKPRAYMARYDDLATIIYTSGTTGKPKGCMHTHETLMHTILFPIFWNDVSSEDVLLSVVPFFHVTGMQLMMNAPIYAGAEMVIMTRWDREIALSWIETYQVTNWTNIPTMVIDLLASPNLKNNSLSSLRFIGGGGASMPKAIAEKLFDLSGLPYAEGYGLTETAAPTHSNHFSRPKNQCLGIPIYNTEAFVIDPTSLEPLRANQTGEIVVRGPQVFKGYWNNEKATDESFININDKAFFRTGDLGYMDEEGYYFIVDRLKRMINASGFKVWPAEIESMMYNHPDIQEACVISSADPRRGETVKAVVVLKDTEKQNDMDRNIINWCKERMAAYKYPRIIEFVDELPKSGSGKVQWRLLQEKENAKR